MAADGDPDEEWQFDLSEVAEDEEPEELQPGSPKLEHVLFVFLGVLATLFAIFRALVG